MIKIEKVTIIRKKKDDPFILRILFEYFSKKDNLYNDLYYIILNFVIINVIFS